MRVPLDESLPRRLGQELQEHAVTTVPEAGWAGKKNGELMRLAEASFDVFVTMDDLTDLQPLAPDLRTAIGRATAGKLVTIEA